MSSDSSGREIMGHIKSTAPSACADCFPGGSGDPQVPRSDVERRRRYVESSRISQGLPARVSDPIALAAIAKVLCAPDKAYSVGIEVWSPRNPRGANDHTAKKSA